MKNQKGFSLIELLIVVVIIGIIAAIAIPNLLAARRAANESSAIGTLRTIVSAEETYRSTLGNGTTYGTLTDLNTGKLVDSVVSGSSGSGTAKSGYNFQYYAGTGVYVVGADCSNTSGLAATCTRHFGSDTTGVIYYNATTKAAITSNAISGTTTPLNN